jgi:hypothetical protein
MSGREHPDEHTTGRHLSLADNGNGSVPVTLEAVHALLVAAVTKLAVIERRSVVWDETTHTLASLHQSVIRLASVTTDLHHRIKPLTFSRFAQVVMIVGASLVGSAVGGAMVAWLLR